jgi:hypothetical protein
VQDTVDLPVAAAREPVSDVVVEGGVDGRGARPGGEVAAVGKSGDIADLDPVANLPPPKTCSSASITSMVNDRLCGSMPMTTRGAS